MKPWFLASVLFFASASTLALPSLASAQDDRGSHLDLDFGTDLPLSVGGSLRLELPSGFHASTGLGGLPKSYVSMINGVVVAFGGYDDATATLVEDALQSSLVWRSHVGYIWPRGFYLDVGYTLGALAGGSSTQDVLETSTGLARTRDESDRRYAIESVIHLLDIEVGYQHEFLEHLVLRVAVGFAATVASRTRVEQQFAVDNPAAQPRVDNIERASARYLDGIYTDYVHTPVLTVAIGYRFF